MYDLLIVDDEPIEREALRYIIRRRFDRIGTIHEASNGREALDLFAEHRPQIVLMDVKMPGISGVSATRAILESRPHTKVVFLTAYDYFEYAQEAVRLGAVDFMVKPASDERVDEVLGRILGELDEEGRAREEHEAEERRLLEASDLLRQEFVRGLVREELSAEQVSRYRDILGLEAERPTVAVSAELDYEAYPARVETVEHRRVLQRRCSRALAAQFNGAGFTVYEAHDADVLHFLLLAGHGAAESAELGRLVETIAPAAAAAVRREYSITARIGLDPTPRVLEFAHRGFRHACVARAEAVAGGLSVVSHGSPRALERASGYPYELEAALFEAVRDGRAEDAHRLAGEAADRLALQGDSHTFERRRLVEMLTVIARRLEIDPAEIVVDEVRALDAYEAADSRARLRSVTLEAVDALCRRPPRYAAPGSHARIDLVRAYIEAHYNEELSLERAAAEARLSPQYLSRAFKKAAGMSFVCYIHATRVRWAKVLLTDTRMSVKEIAAAVGYSDPNYFSRVFKQQTNVTPSAYRDKFVFHGQDHATQVAD
ncbi:MAG: response regulator [Spirochaetaceae bacterium]